MSAQGDEFNEVLNELKQRVPSDELLKFTKDDLRFYVERSDKQSKRPVWGLRIFKKLQAPRTIVQEKSGHTFPPSLSTSELMSGIEQVPDGIMEMPIDELLSFDLDELLEAEADAVTALRVYRRLHPTYSVNKRDGASRRSPSSLPVKREQAPRPQSAAGSSRSPLPGPERGSAPVAPRQRSPTSRSPRARPPLRSADDSKRSSKSTTPKSPPVASSPDRTPHIRRLPTPPRSDDAIWDAANAWKDEWSGSLVWSKVTNNRNPTPVRGKLVAANMNRGYMIEEVPKTLEIERILPSVSAIEDVAWTVERALREPDDFAAVVCGIQASKYSDHMEDDHLYPYLAGKKNGVFTMTRVESTDGYTIATWILVGATREDIGRIAGDKTSADTVNVGSRARPRAFLVCLFSQNGKRIPLPPKAPTAAASSKVQEKRSRPLKVTKPRTRRSRSTSPPSRGPQTGEQDKSGSAMAVAGRKRALSRALSDEERIAIDRKQAAALCKYGSEADCNFCRPILDKGRVQRGEKCLQTHFKESLFLDCIHKGVTREELEKAFSRFGIVFFVLLVPSVRYRQLQEASIIFDDESRGAARDALQMLECRKIDELPREFRDMMYGKRSKSGVQLFVVHRRGDHHKRLANKIQHREKEVVARRGRKPKYRRGSDRRQSRDDSRDRPRDRSRDRYRKRRNSKSPVRNRSTSRLKRMRRSRSPKSTRSKESRSKESSPKDSSK